MFRKTFQIEIAVVFGFLVVGSVSPAWTQTPVGLVDRYSFNDGTANDSVGTSNGTLENGANVLGGALNLNGTGQYLNLGGIGINSMSAVTFEAWGAYNSGTGGWSRIFDFGNTDGGGAGFNYIGGVASAGYVGGPARAIFSNQDPGYLGETDASAPSTAATGNLVYTAITYDNSTSQLSIYMNGVLAGTSTAPPSLNLSNVDNVLGYLGKSLYNDPYLTGSIDEFRVWNTALSADTIAMHQKAGPNAFQPVTQVATWSGIGGFFANPGNWDIGVPSDPVNTAVVVSSGSLTVSADTSGNYIGTTLNGGVMSVSADNQLGAFPGEITVNGGTLQITGTTFNATSRFITLGPNGGGFDIQDPANTLTVSPQLGGPGSLTKLGLGTLVLGSVNSYSGGTTVSAGTLAAGATNALGTGNLYVANAAVVDLNNNDVAVGTLSGSGTITNGGAAAHTFTTNSTADSTFSGVIQNGNGVVNVAKYGPNSLTLSGDNIYTGATAVNAGILILSGSNTGLGPVSVRGSSVLSITGTTSTGTAGTITVGPNAGDTAVLDILPGSVLNANAPGAPSLQAATVSGGTGTIDMTGGTLTTTSELWLSTGNGAHGVMNMSGGVANIEHWLAVGRGGNDGNLYVSGGSLTVLNDNLTIASFGGNRGQVTVSGGTVNAVNSIFVGEGGTGTMTVSGSGIVSAAAMYVGTNAGAVGAVYQTGGAVSQTAGLGVNSFNLGNAAGGFGYYGISGGTVTMTEIGLASVNGGNGMLEVKGGTVNDTGWLTMTRAAGAQTGILSVSAGSLSYAGGGLQCNWGADQTVIINVSGGTISTTNNTDIGLNFFNNPTNTGILNLNGGMVQPHGVYGALAQVDFSGGTLTANADNTNFVAVGSAYVYGGGATIDTNSHNITIAQALLAPTGSGVTTSGLTVSGSGYIAAPIVSVSSSDGNGSGATAVASIDANGNLTGIAITNPGIGYTSSPIFALSGGGGSGSVTGAAVLVANTGGGLTKTGDGILTLSGVNTYSGGTTVLAGTLDVAIPGALLDGTSLTVGADAMTIFGTAAASPAASSGVAIAPVPEPGTLALLIAGVAIGLGVQRRRKGK